MKESSFRMRHLAYVMEHTGRPGCKRYASWALLFNVVVAMSGIIRAIPTKEGDVPSWSSIHYAQSILSFIMSCPVALYTLCKSVWRMPWFFQAQCRTKPCTVRNVKSVMAGAMLISSCKTIMASCLEETVRPVRGPRSF